MKQLLLAAFLLIILNVNTALAEVVVPSLSVQGSAEIEVPADQVEFRLGVDTSATTADEALDQNSKIMDKVIRRLSQAGLSDQEYQTGRFSINPQWQPRPKNSVSDWRPSIIGYRVSNQLLIKTGQFKLIGEWIAKATEEGANSAGQLHFGLQDADAHRGKAIQLATLRARDYAEQAASAAKLTLKGILAMQVNGAHIQPLLKTQLMNEEMAMVRSASVMAPAIDGGDIKVSANVSVTYEIAN